MKASIFRAQNEREKKIRKITLWGSLLNAVLTVLKIISGLSIKSSALVADGFHSLSDLFTDFLVLVGTRLSSRPADETHPYGHKKFETIVSQLMALILFVIGVGFIVSSVRAIIRHEHNFPGIIVLFVAILSVFSKEVLFYKTRVVSRETESAALYANAWHHRSDSLSSVAVLLGGAASLFGWGYGDQVATLVVGFMICGVGVKIFYDCVIELADTAADNESIQAISKILSEQMEVATWHALRTRKLGGELFLDVHICVDPKLSVQEGHDISNRLESQIGEKLSNPVNILVHIEPDENKNEQC
ncbi:MAG: cation diffusion facilitator family transporter [Candidatus Aminicenantes bacterium]|nr:cation diffusion facilitator family transporter [Candidatus Aminicenantes bacterium]